MISLVNQYVWIGIVVAAFFVGVGASYVNFANTYDPMSMKFQNQELFDKMMSNNPRMSQQWMDTSMMSQQQMMQNPDAMNQWMQNMMNDPQAMQQLRQNSKFLSQLQNPTLTNNIAINQNDLMDQISDESVLLLDIREIEQFDQGHIKGAATATCAEDKREKVLSRIPKSIKIILVDQDGTQAPEMAQLILDAGLSSQYLEGGMNNWQGEVVQDPGAKQITPEKLWNRIQQNDNIFLLDVRTPQEFLEYHIPGSVNIPLEYTFDAETTSMIPDDKDVIIICKSGTRATVSSFALAKHGIAGEILDGGIVSWLKYVETKP